tara:strand:- start:4323 stop:5099 length:777 start_codon:yes stop_codon:yes gene_type:complete
MIDQLRKIEDTYERIKFLKDKFKGETIYLVTPGPSLSTHDRDILINKLKGKVVLACKQAYEYVKEVTLFHLLSVYNYQPYEYLSDETIRHWQLTAMNIPNEVKRIKNWQQRMDITIPVYSTPWVNKQNSTAYTKNFKNWELYGEGKVVWGPGIMYESGFPLAMHLGASSIVTIGWDIGDLSKYGTGRMDVDKNWIDQHSKDLYKVDVGGGPEREELEKTINCTDKMYDYFLDKNIEVRILSDSNPADNRFKRITLEEL